MKILYVAFKYEYGNPVRGFSFEHYNFYDTLTKMNEGDNEVVYFSIDEEIKKFGKKEANQKLIKKAILEKPDICFFFLSGDEIEKETIKEIKRKAGAVTFNWFSDDHWRFFNFSRHWAPCFDWIATTDPEAIKKYNKIGYKNVIKTQWACNHFICKPLNLQKKHKISFLGQPHGNRKKTIKTIEKSGFKVECRGWGWPKGCISQEEMIKMFSESKINIGLTNSSTSGLFKSLFQIFLKRKDGKVCLDNPRYWFDNLKAILGKRSKQLKGRNYDVPGCKGFLLTEDAEDLRDRYEDGREIVIFKNKKDLIQKIKYYLSHDKEREAIAEAGYRRTVKDHTYEKRFNEIFKIIGI